MATRQRTTAETYRCPECGGELAFAARSWGCADCGYAPRHGAD